MYMYFKFSNSIALLISVGPLISVLIDFLFSNFTKYSHFPSYSLPETKLLSTTFLSVLDTTMYTLKVSAPTAPATHEAN